MSYRSKTLLEKKKGEGQWVRNRHTLEEGGGRGNGEKVSFLRSVRQERKEGGGLAIRPQFRRTRESEEKAKGEREGGQKGELFYCHPPRGKGKERER